MRELWRKTFELFRRHPVLWMPYACAELLAFSLLTLRRMAYKPILYWFARTTKASVLGGTATTYDWAKGQHEAILFAWPLEWGTRYVNGCLLTAALVATAGCVATFAHAPGIFEGSVLKAIRSRTKGILVYALKLCVLMLAGTIALELPLSNLDFHFNIGPTKYYPLVIAGALAAYSVVAWIMAPVALALLRWPDAPPITAQEKKLSRCFSILVVFSSAILEFAIPRLETHIQLRGRPAATALFALNDLLINLPLLFLFIGLALLALDVPLPVKPAPTFHIPKLVKNLMPLHYPPADEQQ